MSSPVHGSHMMIVNDVFERYQANTGVPPIGLKHTNPAL